MRSLGERLRGRHVHLVGISSLEIADVAVYFGRQGASHLVGHDLCQPDALAEHFRAAHIGMKPEERQAHWEALTGLDLDLRLGDDYLAGVGEADVVVASQAWRLYPANAPLYGLAESGVGFITPLEIVQAVAEQRDIATIGVTGSNGKSTTCNMILSIFEAAGRAAVLAGNYRYRGPVLGRLSASPRPDVLIMEISNHHLLAPGSSVRVAVVTNVTANHLEEHADLAEYVAVKRRLVERQPSGSVTVLNADDPISRGFAERARGEVLTFGLEDGAANASIRGETLTLKRGEGEVELLRCGELRVPGRHNLQNALAAALAAIAMSVDPAHIAEGLRCFDGITGRLEHVRTVDGISFYYDIESTTPESTISGVRAFAGRPLQLIAGGDNKGLSYDGLARAIGEAGGELWVLPGTASQLMVTKARSLGVPTTTTDNLEAAVQCAFERARPRSVVLLSPGAKGFYNRHLRGKPSFRRLVKRLRASDRTTGHP